VNLLKWILVCFLGVFALSACHSKPKVPFEAVVETANKGGGLDVDHDSGAGVKPIVDDIAADSLNRETNLLPVFFDYDRHDIREDQAATLQTDADVLRETPDLQVLIEGHCDERGTEEYNLALGDRRAAVTQTYLAGLGISARRMRTISFGESHPAESGHNENAWSKNRRAEFVEE